MATTAKPKNPPAFPMQPTQFTPGTDGMTLRDYFAVEFAKQFCGGVVMTDMGETNHSQWNRYAPGVAKAACVFADALMAELANPVATHEREPERCMEASPGESWHCSMPKDHTGPHRAFTGHDMNSKALDEWGDGSVVAMPTDGEARS